MGRLKMINLQFVFGFDVKVLYNERYTSNARYAEEIHNKDLHAIYAFIFVAE